MKYKPTGKLDEDQIQFIENRVLELGSMQKVEEFYTKDDTVSIYARKFANTTLKGEEQCQTGKEMPQSQRQNTRWKRKSGK